MTTSFNSRRSDFSQMDDAGISKEHWKIMFISGMGQESCHYSVITLSAHSTRETKIVGFPYLAP
jgi:hypothetical protein